MKLDANCTTDETIKIPNGWTLDGKKKTITAIDPAAGPFIGGVVENDGATAHVKNLKITSAITNFDCKTGNDRFRGIFFDEVSGSIEKNEVSNIHKDGGCQEGNGIEVRNPPFVGFGAGPFHPDTEMVTVSKNKVTNYGKTGIVANGDVFVIMVKNKIGESGFQTLLAANSIQCGFGAKCDISKNKIDGNQWCGGPTDDVATAILLYGAADGSTVVKNKIGGNSDVGIALTGLGFFPNPITEMATVEKNKLNDKGEDCPNSTADVGIRDDGTTNTLTKNKFKGFTDEIGTEPSPVAP